MALDLCWSLLQSSLTGGGAQPAKPSFRQVNYNASRGIDRKFDAGPSHHPFMLAVSLLARSYDVHAFPLTTSSNYLKAGLDYFAIDYFAIMDAKDRGVGGPI